MLSPVFPQEPPETLTACDAFVGYMSLPGEPDPTAILSLYIEGFRVAHTIRPRADLDLALEAAASLRKAGNGKTALLMPGTRFDVTGTRHGRGGGWYDRFLTHVPESWVRVGFCYTDQFSYESIERKPWDMPVDIVCIVDSRNGKVSWCPTSARV